MDAEFNVLDWLFTAGQVLFGVSFFYFLYLVIGQWRITPIILKGLLSRSGLRARRPNAQIVRYLFME